MVQTSSGCSFHCRAKASLQAETARMRKGSVGVRQAGLGVEELAAVTGTESETVPQS